MQEIADPIILARIIRKEYKVSWALAKAIAIAEFAMNYRDLLLAKEKQNVIDGEYQEI